jgi:LuxR family maltose regulon positive regulatory protein
MQKADSLLRTKLRPPFTQPGPVPKPRLQELIAHGLRSPITPIAAPAGFGKATLLGSCVALGETPLAGLRMNKEDSRAGRDLN